MKRRRAATAARPVTSRKIDVGSGTAAGDTRATVVNVPLRPILDGAFGLNSLVNPKFKKPPSVLLNSTVDPPPPPVKLVVCQIAGHAPVKIANDAAAPDAPAKHALLLLPSGELA